MVEVVIKILHVISSLDPRAGGPPSALRGLALAQNEAGLDVSVITTYRQDHDDALEEQIRQAGITLHSVGPTRSPLGTHRDLKRTMARAINEVDLIHIHGLWEDIQHRAANEANSQNKPYLLRPCGMLDPWSLRQSALRKKLYLSWRLRKDLNGARALHYTAAAERDLAAPLGLKPQAIIEPNGIDLSEFDPLPKPGVFRSRFPQFGNKRIILFLSRLHHKKGLDLLIPAFAQADVKNTVLALAGPCDDGYRQELNELIRRTDLANRVVFTGMLRGLERVEAYIDAALFALPSYQENFGIVVVESLAAGTPVMISDQVNIWPKIEQAGVGAICKTNVTSVSEQLKTMLNTDKTPSRKQCRTFVAENYDWRTIADHWKMRYAILIGSGS